MDKGPTCTKGSDTDLIRGDRKPTVKITEHK